MSSFKAMFGGAMGCLAAVVVAFLLLVGGCLVCAQLAQ